MILSQDTRQLCKPADLLLYGGLASTGLGCSVAATRACASPGHPVQLSQCVNDGCALSMSLPLFYFSQFSHELTTDAVAINSHKLVDAQQQRMNWNEYWRCRRDPDAENRPQSCDVAKCPEFD